MFRSNYGTGEVAAAGVSRGEGEGLRVESGGVMSTLPVTIAPAHR